MNWSYIWRKCLFFLFDVGKDCSLFVEPVSSVCYRYDFDCWWWNGHARIDLFVRELVLYLKEVFIFSFWCGKRLLFICWARLLSLLRVWLWLLMVEWICAGRFIRPWTGLIAEGSIYFFFLMWEKTAVYLLSPLAQFVTGMTLTVDGGMDMRG